MVTCPLAVVVPVGLALVVASPGGAAVPAGALVREGPGACDGAVAVEIVGGAGAPGLTGCVPRAALVPTEGWHAIALAGPARGQDLGPVPGEACGAPFGGAPVRLADAETLAGLWVVQAAATELFGPISLDRLAWTPWGFVGLPLVDLDAATISAAWATEGLDTPARREKAIVAVGPVVDGEPVYAHFVGSDPPGSDAWGDPGAIVWFLRLFSAWRAHCVGELHGTPAACVVQVGDLAWFNPKRPDPLGHLDHYLGRCADFRLFRTDGSRYEAWWNLPDDRPGRGSAYDRRLTTAFVSFAMGSGAREVWIGDPAVVAAVPGVGLRKGHDDHLHLCF